MCSPTNTCSVGLDRCSQKSRPYIEEKKDVRANGTASGLPPPGYSWHFRESNLPQIKRNANRMRPLPLNLSSVPSTSTGSGRQLPHHTTARLLFPSGYRHRHSRRRPPFLAASQVRIHPPPFLLPLSSSLPSTRPISCSSRTHHCSASHALRCFFMQSCYDFTRSSPSPCTHHTGEFDNRRWMRRPKYWRPYVLVSFPSCLRHRTAAEIS